MQRSAVQGHSSGESDMDPNRTVTLRLPRWTNTHERYADHTLPLRAEWNKMGEMDKMEGRDGVADGTRTHDNRNHNPGLYQLSYSHH